MDNSSRRGFFGQLMAGLAGCLFFPFFKKEPNKIQFPKPDKNDDIFLRGVNRWGNPITFWGFDGKGNMITIVNNTGINLNSKSTSLSLTAYRS